MKIEFNALDNCKSQLMELALIANHSIELNIGQLTQSLNIMNGRE